MLAISVHAEQTGICAASILWRGSSRADKVCGRTIRVLARGRPCLRDDWHVAGCCIAMRLAYTKYTDCPLGHEHAHAGGLRCEHGSVC